MRKPGQGPGFLRDGVLAGQWPLIDWADLSGS
jgi:hypothetical protein